MIKPTHGLCKDRFIFGLTMADLSILHTRGDYLFLDYVLSQHKAIDRGVELGTFRGLTTLYVAICMGLRNGNVVTIDLPGVGQLDQRVLAMWPGNVERLELDVFEQVGQVASYITNRTLLICDDGHKLTEARLYAPYIQDNSVMMIHDRGVEWQADTMIKQMMEAGLHEIHDDFGERMGSTYMVFKRDKL